MTTRMILSDLLRSGSILCDILPEESRLKTSSCAAGGQGSDPRISTGQIAKELLVSVVGNPNGGMGGRAIVAAGNMDLDDVEKALKQSKCLMLEEISTIDKELIQLQSNEKSLQASLHKRKMELERDEERLATFMNVRPAYMDEYETLQNELRGLFALYVERFRNLQWLEAQLEGFHAIQQQKQEEVQHQMRSIQCRFQEEELKLLQATDMVSFSIGNEQGSDSGDYENRTAEYEKCFPATWGNVQTVDCMKADGGIDSLSSGTPSLDQEENDNDSDNVF